MCGRFTQLYSWAEVHVQYNLIIPDPIPNLESRYNVAPTQRIDIVVQDNGGRALSWARWGLVPFFWKKTLKEAARLSTFNAKSEEAATKPFFRAAMKARRCIVPASGFYEWRTEDGQKQPYYITAAGGEILSFAGLWETWKDPETDERLVSSTIMTTAANETMRELHHRMPVILTSDQVAGWMVDGDQALLAPCEPGMIEFRRVSRKVNNVRNQGLELLEVGQ
ncbi:MAG: SOS response-associated peptidase [Parvibaculum sp.]